MPRASKYSRRPSELDVFARVLPSQTGAGQKVHKNDAFDRPLLACKRFGRNRNRFSALSALTDEEKRTSNIFNFDVDRKAAAKTRRRAQKARSEKKREHLEYFDKLFTPNTPIASGANEVKSTATVANQPNPSPSPSPHFKPSAWAFDFLNTPKPSCKNLVRIGCSYEPLLHRSTQSVSWGTLGNQGSGLVGNSSSFRSNSPIACQLPYDSSRLWNDRTPWSTEQSPVGSETRQQAEIPTPASQCLLPGAGCSGALTNHKCRLHPVAKHKQSRFFPSAQFLAECNIAKRGIAESVDSQSDAQSSRMEPITSDTQEQTLEVDMLSDPVDTGEQVSSALVADSATQTESYANPPKSVQPKMIFRSKAFKSAESTVYPKFEVSDANTFDELMGTQTASTQDSDGYVDLLLQHPNTEPLSKGSEDEMPSEAVLDAYTKLLDWLIAETDSTASDTPDLLPEGPVDVATDLSDSEFQEFQDGESALQCWCMTDDAHYEIINAIQEHEGWSVLLPEAEMRRRKSQGALWYGSAPINHQTTCVACMPATQERNAMDKGDEEEYPWAVDVWGTGF